MKALVTGADGFVASHLCEYLLERGCDITGLVKRNSGNILKNIKHLEGKMDIVWGDMCDSSQMLKITKGIDVVFHLAAQSHVAYSLVNPVETFQQNVLGSLYLLEAVRFNGVRRLVHAGSAEVYGSTQYKPLVETSPLIPRSAYAAGKAAVDRLMYAYWCSYQTPVVMSRFFAIYGPRQSYEKAIPKFIYQAAKGLPITIYGHGNQTRDWMYVTDCARAYGMLGLDADDSVLGEVVNIAGHYWLSVREIAEDICNLMNKKCEMVFDESLREGEAPHLICEPKKMNQYIDWSPAVIWEDGLQKTIEYYLEHLYLMDRVGERY